MTDHCWTNRRSDVLTGATRRLTDLEEALGPQWRLQPTLPHSVFATPPPPPAGGRGPVQRHPSAGDPPGEAPERVGAPAGHPQRQVHGRQHPGESLQSSLVPPPFEKAWCRPVTAASSSVWQTGRAIKFAVDHVFPSSQRGGRVKNRIAVVVTDGKSQDDVVNVSRGAASCSGRVVGGALQVTLVPQMLQ